MNCPNMIVAFLNFIFKDEHFLFIHSLVSFRKNGNGPIGSAKENAYFHMSVWLELEIFESDGERCVSASGIGISNNPFII